MNGAYLTLASLPDYLRLSFALLFNTSSTWLSSAFLSLASVLNVAVANFVCVKFFLTQPTNPGLLAWEFTCNMTSRPFVEGSTTTPLSSQILSTGNHLVSSQCSSISTRHQTSHPLAPTFRWKISPQTSVPNSAERLLMPACKTSFRDYPLQEPLTTTCKSL